MDPFDSDSDPDPYLNGLVDSDDEEEVKQAAVSGMMSRMVPDEGYLFDWDEDSTGHNLWFEVYEGNSADLEFEGNVKPGSDRCPINFKKQLPANLPKWKDVLLSVLKEHPLGLAEGPLKKKIYEIAKVPNRNFFPYAFAELIEKEVDTIVPKTVLLPFKKRTIYFLKNEATANLDVNALVARLCHRIKCIVSLNSGILKPSDLFPQLTGLLGLTFDPQDWEFKNAEELIENFTILVPTSDLMKCSSIEAGQNSSEIPVYLVIDDGTSSEINYMVEDEQQLHKTMKFRWKKAVLNREYARIDDYLPCVSTSIEENHYHECFILNAYSLSDFNMIMVENWNTVERFQATLGEYFLENSKYIPPLAGTKRLRRGMYVAALWRKEWYRALVTKPYSEETGKCWVSLVDFGEEISIRPSQLRLVPKEMMDSFWAQAINCRLRTDDQSQKYLTYIQEEIVDGKKLIYKTFWKIAKPDPMSSKKFVVYFHKYVELEEGKYIWEVDWHSVERREQDYLKLDTILEDGVVRHLIKKLAEVIPIPDSIINGPDQRISTDNLL